MFASFPCLHNMFCVCGLLLHSLFFNPMIQSPDWLWAEWKSKKWVAWHVVTQRNEKSSFQANMYCPTTLFMRIRVMILMMMMMTMMMILMMKMMMTTMMMMTMMMTMMMMRTWQAATPHCFHQSGHRPAGPGSADEDHYLHHRRHCHPHHRHHLLNRLVGL